MNFHPILVAYYQERCLCSEPSLSMSGIEADRAAQLVTNARNSVFSEPLCLESARYHRNFRHASLFVKGLQTVIHKIGKTGSVHGNQNGNCSC